MATPRQNINKPTDEQKSTMGRRHRKKLQKLNESCSKLIAHLIIIASEQETQGDYKFIFLPLSMDKP